jgi:hypothetical protein
MATSNGSLLPLSRSAACSFCSRWIWKEINVEGLEFASQILIGTCVNSLATGFEDSLRKAKNIRLAYSWRVGDALQCAQNMGVRGRFTGLP